jgi:hypothetical protein
MLNNPLLEELEELFRLENKVVSPLEFIPEIVMSITPLNLNCHP